MNRIELIDKRELLKSEAEGIISAAETEKRTLTAEEDARVTAIGKEMDGIEGQLAELDATLKREFQNRGAGKKGAAGVEKRDFSLLRAISDVANGRPLSETETEVIEAGIEEMRKSAQPWGGQIVLPVSESRGAIQSTVATAGMENVQTDVLGIMSALRKRLVLVKAGASYLTGLSGNLSIPVYSGSNVAWASETGSASDGGGTFSEVTLSPKRLTAYLDISKQFLLQDSNDAESLLRSDLIRAVSEKLESTLLGGAAGTSTQPAGLFNVITPVSLTPSWDEIVDMEKTLEDANVYGPIVYLVNPSLKATLRTTARGMSGSSTSTGSSGDITVNTTTVNGFIYEHDEINGIRALVSNSVLADSLALGNFSDYVIGQWGGIDVTVDPYTQATKGVIRLVVNAYFDAKPRRAESFVTATV
ncbi:MAG: phage major capsid protein [Tannerella sp.]|jgi:HK97 family phage major capsid protein|nr:phage major capsid protein [Tannerella sp.]